LKKLIVVFAVAICLIAAFLLLRPRKPSLPMATLPDGTQIILQAVTWGTNHHFMHGSKLVRAAKRFTPGFIDSLLPPVLEMTTTMDEENLVVWYNAYHPATNKYVTLQWERFTIVDDHGCTFRMNQYGGSHSTAKFAISHAVLRVFPRRQKTFILRAKFVNQPEVELQVPNPLYPVTAEWTPEPLPAQRATNNLKVTLKRIRTHRPNTYITTDFDIFEDGVKRNAWYDPARYFSDASGNRDNSSGNFLFTNERAWKVEADFYKAAGAPFPELAIWRIPNVVIPKSGELLRFTNETKFGGFSITPIALCGAGDFIFSNEVCAFSAPWQDGWQENSSCQAWGMTVSRFDFRSQKPSLMARVDGLRNSQDLLIRLQTPDGRAHPLSRSASVGDFWWLQLKDAGGGETFHLEFIPQKPVRLEFLVQPPRP